MKFVAVIPLALMALTVASAIPKPDEKHGKDRVHDKEPLSKQEHFNGDEDHNPEYDHEAFLGEEEAHNFDDLSPEESKERLAIIYDKIDTDRDGFVTELELKDWIKRVQNKYIIEDAERQWKDHKIEDGKLSWEQYKERTYGDLDVDSQINEADGDDGFSYKQMMGRDEKRWKKADQDNDGLLSIEEFAAFLHPEDAEHMRDIVIDETIEDIDKDNDGLISLEEYVADMNAGEIGDVPADSDDHREFKESRDKNGDDKMDKAEVAQWIFHDDSEDKDFEEEAKHLVQQADENKDGKLSKEEVIEKYDLFVGSQATDFGEALQRHDEF